MPSRNRLLELALGGYLIAALVAISPIATLQSIKAQETVDPALELEPIAAERDAESGSTTEEDTAPEHEHTSDLRPAIKDLESAIRDLIPKPNEKERKQQEHREVADLKAQEEMATWAKPMFFAAAASCIVTAAGVILIWLTFIQTGNMLDEAKRATEAANKTAASGERSAAEARKQTEIARFSIRVQEAPHLYVKVSQPHYRTDIGEPYVEYRFANLGRTPAIVEHFAAELAVDPRFPLPHFRDKLTAVYEVVGPGKETDLRRAAVKSTGESEKWKSNNGTVLIFYGAAQYIDVLKIFHTYSFCLGIKKDTEGFVVIKVSGNEHYNDRSYCGGDPIAIERL